ncbi:hypothetical protein KUV89_14980 [Marinobacter hydrocarbonoclasticus]|nr:hypothetical protein [Marinobacter nauticus]
MRRIALILMLIVFSQTALAGLGEHRPHLAGSAEHVEMADHQHLELAEGETAEYGDLCLHCHCHGGQSGLVSVIALPSACPDSADFHWLASYQPPFELPLSPPPIA